MTHPLLPSSSPIDSPPPNIHRGDASGCPVLDHSHPSSPSSPHQYDTLSPSEDENDAKLSPFPSRRRRSSNVNKGHISTNSAHSSSPTSPSHQQHHSKVKLAPGQYCEQCNSGTNMATRELPLRDFLQRQSKCDSGTKKTGKHSSSSATPHFPIEILYEILWYLSFVQILPLANVSKLWYYVTHSEVFLNYYVRQLPVNYVDYSRRQLYDSLRILRDWPFQSFYHLDRFTSAADDSHTLWRIKWYIHLSGLFKGHIIPPSCAKPSSESDIERKKKSQFIKCQWNKEQMKRLVDGKKYVNDIVLVEGSITDVSYSGVNNHFATVSLKVDKIRGQQKNVYYHVRYFISLLGILFGFFGSVFVICLVGQLATLGLLALYFFKSFWHTSKFGCLFSVRYVRSQRDRVFAAKEKFVGITSTGWNTLISHIATINTLLSVIAEEKWRLLTQRIQDINYTMYDASNILKDFKYRLIVEKEEIMKKISSTLPHDTDMFNAAFKKLSREAHEIVRTLEESGDELIDELMD